VAVGKSSPNMQQPVGFSPIVDIVGCCLRLWWIFTISKDFVWLRFHVGAEYLCRTPTLATNLGQYDVMGSLCRRRQLRAIYLPAEIGSNLKIKMMLTWSKIDWRIIRIHIHTVLVFLFALLTESALFTLFEE
jgi:hypothetical protein